MAPCMGMLLVLVYEASAACGGRWEEMGGWSFAHSVAMERAG